MSICLVGTDQQPEDARQATGSNLVEDEEVNEGSIPTPRLQADVVPTVTELLTRVAISYGLYRGVLLTGPEEQSIRDGRPTSSSVRRWVTVKHSRPGLITFGLEFIQASQPSHEDRDAVSMQNQVGQKLLSRPRRKWNRS